MYTLTQKGFTLLELILIVAMIGIIATMSSSFGVGFLWRTDLSQAQYLSVVSVRRAQVLASAQAGDSDWGVRIERNQLTIFKGSDFTGREVDSDEAYDLGSVTAVTPVDVVYHKLSGLPYVNSSIIDLVTNTETAQVSINSEGTVIY